MATKIAGNSVQLGDSATAAENFVLQSNVDGTLTLARGNLGATIHDILTVDENNVVHLDGGLVVEGTGRDTGFRNKIIGGDFHTNPWQRGTSFAGVATAFYTADRFQVSYVTAGVVSVLKTADAPAIAQTGIYTSSCLHVDVTTADASIAAGDFYAIQQKIEGYNIAQAGFGQSGVRSITLSFWHKHTVTGTYCAFFRNSAADRSYVAEYTQAIADTWEKATITLDVDTAGTWLYGEDAGLTVGFAITSGTTFQTAANAWTAGNFLATSNQVNGLSSTANNFKLALIQLEVGSVASGFEVRSVQDEVNLCKRYYQRSIGNASAVRFAGNVTSGTAYVSGVILFVPSMRDTPTMALTHIAGASFAAAAGTATPDAAGFVESRTANATAPGSFASSWTAFAEL
jgi:hypothetical protein